MSRKKKDEVRYDKDGVRKVMRIRDYFADSLGQFSLNAISGIVGQLTYFYTDKVGLAAGAIATIFMVAKIIDAFTDVFMGNIVDNTKPGKEKYRPWLLRAGIPAGLMLIAMFTVPKGTSTFQLAYVLITNVILTAILYTAIAVPYVSLQIVRTNSQEERSFIGTWRAAAGYVSGMVIAILIIPITNMLGGTQSAWIKFGVFFGALTILFMLICYKYARESAVDASNTNEEQVVEEAEEQISLMEALNKLVHNRYWVILLVIVFASNVSYGVTAVAGTYYAKWIYGNDNLVAVAGGLGLVPTILGFAFLTPMIKKFGPTKLLKYMAAISVVVNAVRIINPDNFVFNTAMGMITTFAGIPIMALATVLTGMTIDYNEYKYGIKMVGRTSSIQSFSNKIGNGLGAAVIGWCLALASYDATASVATEAVRQAIFTFSIYIPIILNAIMFIGLSKFDLESRLGEIHAAIAKRNAQKEDHQE